MMMVAREREKEIMRFIASKVAERVWHYERTYRCEILEFCGRTVGENRENFISVRTSEFERVILIRLIFELIK